MDMKKLLQVMDGVSNSTSGESVSEMKQILNILTEGSTPHKVSLPVQMAMQHYNAIVDEKPTKVSLFKEYFKEAEETNIQKTVEKRKEIYTKAKIIAERVQTKEQTIPGHSMGFKSGPGPGLQSNEPNESSENPKDIVKMDIPLLIRLLEYSREDAKTDMDLHNITDKLIHLSTHGDVLTMDDYDTIVGEQKMLPAPTNENCWKGYQQIGMKKKGNRNVPNCVPKGK